MVFAHLLNDPAFASSVLGLEMFMHKVTQDHWTLEAGIVNLSLSYFENKIQKHQT
jgi:hypothetical protein